MDDNLAIALDYLFFLKRMKPPPPPPRCEKNNDGAKEKKKKKKKKKNKSASWTWGHVTTTALLTQTKRFETAKHVIISSI